jgi:uncharacterized protein YjbI with pentapeptide repeats
MKLGHLDHTLDLRGAQFVSGDRMVDFNLVSGEFRDADLSFGKGAIGVHSAKIEKLVAKRFAFDRASSFIKCQVIDADFEGAAVKCTAEDAEFVNCVFRNTTFKGGAWDEFGFRRCVFRNCNFQGIRWRNTYLRAVELHQCDFTDARLETSTLVGVRFFGFQDWRLIVKKCEFEGLYIDGVRLASLD